MHGLERLQPGFAFLLLFIILFIILFIDLVIVVLRLVIIIIRVIIVALLGIGELTVRNTDQHAKKTADPRTLSPPPKKKTKT